MKKYPRASFAFQDAAIGGTNSKHTLKIEPVFDPANPDGELHIESVCSAG